MLSNLQKVFGLDRDASAVCQDHEHLPISAGAPGTDKVGPVARLHVIRMEPGFLWHEVASWELVPQFSTATKWWPAFD